MQRPELTAKQRLLLDAIRSYIAEHGYPPSLRELGPAVGLAHVSSIAYQINQLKEKGYIRQAPGVPRGLVIESEAA